MKEYAKIKIKSKISYKETRLIPKEGLVLDVGCANGALSTFTGKNRYKGIDINPHLVSYCKKRGLDVKQSNITKIPFKSNTFRCVYCRHVIEHVSSQEQYIALKEFFRVLKPGGRLILFAPTPYNWYFYDDPTHVRPLTHGSLELMAKDTGFVKIKTFYSNAKFLSKILQKYLRILPLPFLFWEVCLICEKQKI